MDNTAALDTFWTPTFIHGVKLANLLDTRKEYDKLLGELRQENDMTACAGLRIRSNTLKANRMTVIVSMCEVGPYGDIEDWSGSIDVEVLLSCTLPEKLQRVIAIGLATKEVEYWLDVQEWDVMPVGNLWVLKPLAWEEKPQ